MLQAFASFLLFPTLFAFLVFPLFPIGFWVRLRNSNLQYKELTSGFDLNNALGRYRSGTTSIVKSLVNAPPELANAYEIIVEWYQAQSNNAYGIQLIYCRLGISGSADSRQYIRSRNADKWNAWEQVTLKSDLGDMRGIKVAYSFDAAYNINTPPAAFILQAHTSHTTGDLPAGLGGTVFIILQSNPGNDSHNGQFAFGFATDKIAFRKKNGSTTWDEWKYVTFS